MSCGAASPAEPGYQALRDPGRTPARQRSASLSPAAAPGSGDRGSAHVPRGAAALGDPGFRQRARALSLRSWRWRAGRDLLPGPCCRSLAAVLLLVGVVILGLLQARRADQARLLAQPAGAGRRARAAPQGLPDRLQHAAGRSADLCGPPDPAGRPRSDRAAHRHRRRHPRRRAPAGVAGRRTADLLARRPKLRQRLVTGCCRAPPEARCAGPWSARG